MQGDTLSAHKRALCDNIDAWTMWLSPPIFLIFNLVYWIAYRHVETASLEYVDQVSGVYTGGLWFTAPPPRGVMGLQALPPGGLWVYSPSLIRKKQSLTETDLLILKCKKNPSSMVKFLYAPLCQVLNQGYMLVLILFYFRGRQRESRGYINNAV